MIGCHSGGQFGHFKTWSGLLPVLSEYYSLYTDKVLPGFMIGCFRIGGLQLILDLLIILMDFFALISFDKMTKTILSVVLENKNMQKQKID